MSVSQLEQLNTEIEASGRNSIDLMEEQKHENVVAADFRTSTVIPRQDFDAEMEFGETAFPVGEKQPLRARHPLQLGYTETEGLIEVKDWGVQAEIKNAHELPRLIGRRFMELFSKSQTVGLNEIEEACFATICEQVDFRAFCLSREMPRYREATFLRRASGVALKFLSEEFKLAPGLVDQLGVLTHGQRFGAWFSVDVEGELTAIKNLIVLPAVADDDFGEMLDEIPTIEEDSIPEFIREMLRRKSDGQDKSD